LASAILPIPTLAGIIYDVAHTIQAGGFANQYSTAAMVIFGVHIGLDILEIILSFILGLRILRDKRYHAAALCSAMIIVTIGITVCNIMLRGYNASLIALGILLVILIVLQSYLDPALHDERELQRKLRDMETREQAEDGTLGLDQTGKGYISLNFFNLFWIFVISSILGILLETLYHYYLFGSYENRAGLLFGPFSPIYGFGAVIMTCALNRHRDANFIIIFLISAVIGGAFEYCVSWFLQFSFGVVAWDYSGTFLSIDGRTNGMYMAIWGVLGVLWIKIFLPIMLKIVNAIPWNWRYTITTICAALLIVDGVLTLLAMDCWYSRSEGKQPETAAEVYMNDHFGDDFMQNRFQSMYINPSTTTRAD
jgi:uncharacterized membrane protein